MLQHLLEAALLHLRIDLLRHEAILLDSEGDGIKPWALHLACSRTKPTATTDASACGATTTSAVTDTTHHYDNTGTDSPAWTLTRTGGGTPTTSRDRNTTDLGGALLAVITTPASGPTTTAFQLTNLHGDICVTSTPAATGAPDGTAITTDEYGNPTTTPASTPTYSWHGSAQRQTDQLTGIILLGVRLYAPMSGRFLSQDPLWGANPTTYGYPHDPINVHDLTGNGPSSEGPLNCKDVGLNILQCKDALAASNEVVQVWDGNSNRQNAGRHFVWNLVLYIRLGAEPAFAFIDAHENGSGNMHDQIRDWSNNRRARQYLKWADKHMNSDMSDQELTLIASAKFRKLWRNKNSYFTCVYAGFTKEAPCGLPV